MASSIFSGNFVKFLKSKLNINDAAYILADGTDPRTSATNAPIGSLHLNTSSGAVTKKTDAGSSTNWSEVGVGSGTQNYIAASDGSAIGAWATYADAAATSPVDGTGGSPSSTFAVSTSSAMNGITNFLWTHSAANRQGEGFSYTMAIDPADRGRVLRLSFDYKVDSGTYADNDMTIWFYDVTNSALIQPAPYQIKNSGLIETFNSEVQIPSSCASLRVIFHVATSTATAYTLRFDNFVFGRQQKSYGSPITDWVTPTSNAVLKYSTTTATNITSTTTKYRRVGDNYEYQVNVKFNGAANATGNILLTLADGHTIDTSKVARTSYQVLGHAEGYLNSKVYFGDVRMSNTSTNTLQITRSDDSGATDTAWIGSTVAGSNVPTGVALTATDEIQYKFSFPASGLSSSVQMSDSADTRVVAFEGRLSGTQTLATTAETTIQFNTVQADTHAGLNASTYTYTIPTSGYYDLSASIQTNGDLLDYHVIRIKVNGSTRRSMARTLTATEVVNSVYALNVYCNAGDTVTATTNTSADSSYNIVTGPNTALTVKKLSGPSSIAASETVAVRAHRNGSTQTGVNPNNSPVKITLNSVASPGFDSHAAFDTTNNRYIIQTAGKYAVNASIWSQATNVLNNRYILMIYKNGSENIRGQDYVPPAATAFGIVGSGIINCVSGDYIELYLYGVGNNSASTLTISGSAAETAIHITRIGNY